MENQLYGIQSRVDDRSHLKIDVSPQKGLLISPSPPPKIPLNEIGGLNIKLEPVKLIQQTKDYNAKKENDKDEEEEEDEQSAVNPFA